MSKERELLSEFKDWHNKRNRFSILSTEIDSFLAGRPEEKGKCQNCKHFHPPVITEPCFSCEDKSEFNPNNQ